MLPFPVHFYYSFHFCIDHSKLDFYTNADTMPEWEHIEVLRLRSSYEESCSICLDIPIFPKASKCGHIFWYACMPNYTHCYITNKHTNIGIINIIFNELITVIAPIAKSLP